MKKISSIVGLKEFRENAPMYIREIEKGRSFTVVRKSKPVFKMVPVVDQWGDEGKWTDLDFRDKKGRGMPIEKMIQKLQKIYERS